MSDELVTVSISTYNRFEGLIKTLKSVVEQTYKNLEIIIVDDCSSDLTTLDNIKKKFPDEKRIKYFRHQKNSGLSEARNTALYNSKGKFFTFIDDDDLWNINCIRIFVHNATKHDDLNCFCGGIKFKNRILKYNYNKISLKEAIYAGWTPPVSAQFYHKKSLIKIGGFNKYIKSGIDHHLWLNLSVKNYNIVFLEECISIPNYALNYNKMTTDYDKRIIGIQNSLKIWKPIIINTYGIIFYDHFVNEYNIYLFKFFMIKSLRTLNFKEFFKIIFLNKNYKKLFFIFLLLINQFANINKDNYIKPTFKKFYD